MENKIKNLNLSIQQLATMTDEQIRANFKNSASIIDLKLKTIKMAEQDENETFMKKYKCCPKCKAPIEKFDG
jgi:hypothetical protein